MAAPPLAFVSLVYATRPRVAADVAAPARLAAVRGALAVGAFAVLTVEALGAAGKLTAPAVGLAWLSGLIAATALAAWRWRRDGSAASPLAAGRGLVARWGSYWRTASRPERAMGAVLAALVLLDLVVALLSPPNNFDSQTYHLPKVEHWVAQGNLNFWPTAIHRQVTIPPGAEYLLVHLRLLTGGDALYNLVQWCAGLGCLLIASRIAAQLGGGRRAQLITAFVIGTTPMVVLQATSTQTDLVVAAWTGCLATLALHGLTRRASGGSVLALGAATGLTAITKTSGLLGAGPLLLLWGIGQVRLVVLNRPGRRRIVGGTLSTLAASIGILATAAVIVGPSLLRVDAEFGNLLGPPRLRESIPMQRHDPASVLINGLRVAHTALDTPLAPLRTTAASAIIGLAHVIGVDPQDRATTFGQTRFPVVSWYPDEDRVAFPIAGGLALFGTAVALARPRRISPERPGTLRAYAAAVGVAAVLYAATIKWQPWGNRLLLFALVLAAPLAGLWLDALFRQRAAQADRSTPAQPDQSTAAQPHRSTRVPVLRGRSLAVLAAVAVLAGSALSGVLTVSYGFPRRLVGSGSLLTSDSWNARFVRRPQWAKEFRWAAAQVDGAGAHRIGLVQQNDNWEYPWWLLLRDHEVVALQSVLPKHAPAAPSSVDAIVCTGNRAVCGRFVPPGWRFEFRGYVGYAVPPRQ